MAGIESEPIRAVRGGERIFSDSGYTRLLVPASARTAGRQRQRVNLSTVGMIPLCPKGNEGMSEDRT